MSCRRTGPRRRFLPHLEGRLGPRRARRLENHLRRCPDCRAEYERLREGHHLAQRLSALSPAEAPASPDLESFMAGGAEPGPRGWLRRRWSEVLTRPRIVAVLAVIVALQMGGLLISGRGSRAANRGAAALRPSALDVSRFQAVRIADLPANTLPHVATEGFVRNVRVDPQEKTVHFVLAQNPEGPGPVVICEIMNPAGIPVPREGARVRVYGVARYDAQAGRNWHEINPVLDIDVLE